MKKPKQLNRLPFFFLLFLFSCANEVPQPKEALPMAMEETDQSVFQSKLDSFFLTFQFQNTRADQLKKWAYNHLFDPAKVEFPDLFFQIQRDNEWIQLHNFQGYDLFVIQYHPYWANSSGIVCFLVADSQILGRVELRGDRHETGTIKLEDFDHDGQDELIHVLSHKIPMAKFVEEYHGIHDWSEETKTFHLIADLMAAQIDCVEEGGMEYKYEFQVQKHSIEARQFKRKYDCDRFGLPAEKEGAWQFTNKIDQYLWSDKTQRYEFFIDT